MDWDEIQAVEGPPCKHEALNSNPSLIKKIYIYIYVYVCMYVCMYMYKTWLNSHGYVAILPKDC
jgi:hypothetical protein